MRTRAFRLLSAATAALLTGCGTDVDPSGFTPNTIVETIGDPTVVRTLSGSVWGTEAILVPEITIGQVDGAEEYLFLTAAQPVQETADLRAAWAVVRGCDTELLAAGEALVDVLARSRTSVTDPTVQAARDRHANALNRHLAALIVAEVEMLERGLVGTDAVSCPDNIVEQAEAALRRLPR